MLTIHPSHTKSILRLHFHHHNHNPSSRLVSHLIRSTITITLLSLFSSFSFFFCFYYYLLLSHTLSPSLPLSTLCLLTSIHLRFWADRQYVLQPTNQPDTPPTFLPSYLPTDLHLSILFLLPYLLFPISIAITFPQENFEFLGPSISIPNLDHPSQYLISINSIINQFFILSSPAVFSCLISSHSSSCLSV